MNNRKFDHKKASRSWFELLHYEVRERIILTYAFAHSLSLQQATTEASILESTISSDMISDVYNYRREFCMDSLDRSIEEEG